jgi:hypothetical protein
MSGQIVSMYYLRPTKEGHLGVGAGLYCGTNFECHMTFNLGVGAGLYCGTNFECHMTFNFGTEGVRWSYFAIKEDRIQSDLI